MTYHQLGRVAEEQRDFAAAEGWYRKALAIFERLHDLHLATVVQKSLQRLAEQRENPG